MSKKAVPNEIMCTDTKRSCFERNHVYKYEKRLFLTKSCVQIRKKAVLNENRSKDVEKRCFERDGATMIKLAREEGVLPCIAKVLSAQTFPTQHFESFGIDTSMMYDKTDALKNVFMTFRAEIHMDFIEYSI